MLNDHLFIVMAKEHYNPLGLLRSLGEQGIRPVYIAIRGKVAIASQCSYISQCHHVDTVEEGYQVLLKEYGNFDEEHKPFILCDDDLTLGFLDSHYEEICNRFYYFNAGKNDGINQYMDKANILEIAQTCGLDYARTVVCMRGEIPEGLTYPIITKSISPNVGGWKADVFICRSEEDLRAAYEKIKAPKVLLQQYIEKKNELEYYGISVDHGRDVCFTITSRYLYTIPGYYSPYMDIFVPPYPEVQEKLRELIRKIGFEGIFTVEFLVGNDDKLYFLEVNFRNGCWNYSSTCAGMNLPCLWAEGMLEKHIPKNAVVPFEPFQAMVEPIDYGKRVDTGKITPAQWLADFKNAKVTYYYNKKDTPPLFCNDGELGSAQISCPQRRASIARSLPVRECDRKGGRCA